MKNYTINTIDLQAKEWFDKVNGNSYFAAIITLNFGTDTERALAIPFQYGYGNQYETEALNTLQSEGYISSTLGVYSLQSFCRENNIILRSSKKDKCLKRELTALTQYV